MKKPKENDDAIASFNAYWPTHLINNAENKRKKGHGCTNQKKRYEGRSNCYNPQLHESG